MTLPFIAFGYSLGSKVALAVHQLHLDREEREAFECLILNTPPFRANIPAFDDFIFGLKAKADLTPDSTEYSVPQVDRNEDYSFLWIPYQDPLFFPGPYPAKTFYELLSDCALANDRPEKINVPIFFCLANKDSHVDNEKAKEYFEKVPSEYKKMISYDYEHIMLYNG